MNRIVSAVQINVAIAVGLLLIVWAGTKVSIPGPITFREALQLAAVLIVATFAGLVASLKPADFPEESERMVNSD